MVNINFKYLGVLFLFTVLIVNSIIACENKSKFSSIFLVGSTPGGTEIKTKLGIPSQTSIDFIRWDFELEGTSAFVLKIRFGESQPNTLGFKNGGEIKEFRGSYSINKKKSFEIYTLKSKGLNISLVKLNENLFHILTDNGQLMSGNGGWSYTLNNKSPSKLEKLDNSFPLMNNNLINDKSAQVIYEGRTPCQEFARDYNFSVSKSCFKLKWKLTLNKNPETFMPSTYSFRRVIDNIPGEVTGNWKIINGIDSNPNAIIIQLDPENPEKSLTFLVGDDNVIFFIGKDESLYVGNENFSFTLNRKII